MTIYHEDDMNQPLLGFSAEIFQRRRAQVMEGLGGGVMILPAAPVSIRSRDTQHRYRPDSDLFYLTGCLDPGVVAVLSDPEEGPGFRGADQRHAGHSGDR